MDWVSFGVLLSENLRLYGLILVCSILIYALIFKKFFISVLDPLLYAVLFSVFGFSVVWFLYFTKSIEPRYLYSYLLTQFAFWIGLFTFKSLSRTKVSLSYIPISWEEEHHFTAVFFILTSGLYVLIQLLSYQVIGIPLLLGTHIDIYNGAGGWGLLGRLLDVLKPCAIYMLILYLFKKTSVWMTLYKYTFLVAVVIFLALSGSKGEFMLLGFVIFCCLLLNAFRFIQHFRRINKIGLWLIVAGVFFALFTIVIQPGSTADDQTTIGVFLYRLVASGDAYFFAYPNHNIEHLDHSRPFLALFGDILSTVRLIPRQNQPVILGVQLFRLFSDLDISAGPNARHNVFGYVYFGFFGSIIFSYTIGFVLSLVRNVLFFDLRKTNLGQLAFVLLYINLAGIETDPPMAVSNLENVLLIFPLLIVVAIVAVVLLVKNNSSANLKIPKLT